MRTSLTLPALIFALTFTAAGYAQARDIGERAGASASRAEEPTPAQEGELLLKERITGTNFCHMQFPAIDEDTLAGRPELKAPSSGDIIDFYGSCDYDPDGRLAINEQKHDHTHWWSKSYDS